MDQRAGRPDLPGALQQAGRLIDDDPRYAVWPSRVLADIYGANMEPEASLATHAAECAALLTEQAHTEAVVEAHTTTDELRRKTITLVERWSGRPLGHGGIRADRKRLDNARGRAESD